MNNLRTCLLIATLIPVFGLTLVTVPPIAKTSLAQTQNSQEEELQKLLQQAVQQREQRQALQSIETFQQALAIARQLKERELEAIILSNIGFAYNTLGQPQKALDFYKQALPIYKEVGDRSGEATILNNIGEVYYGMGQPQKALEDYNKALPIFQEVGDRSGEAAALNNIGRVYYVLGQLQQALDYYNQALPILQEVGDRFAEATTLNNIGSIYHVQGKLRQALEYYEKVVSISHEVNDTLGAATTLGNIGGVYYVLGQPQKALDYFNQALPIFQEAKNRSEEATILNNIGRVYHTIGQPQKALDFYNQALPILREVKNRSMEATTLNNIGGVYDGIGQLQKALKYYNQALPIFQKVGERSGVATTQNNIGRVYDRIGQPQKALDYYNQALSIFREVGNRSEEATTLNNIGRVYDDRGETQQALNFYNHALLIREEVGDHSGKATTLNNIGIVYNDRGETQQALDYYNQALSIFQEVGNRSVEWITLGNLGFLSENQGETEDAIKYYTQAIEVKESIQSEIKVDELKASFASHQIDLYERLINLLWNKSDFKDAFNYVERAKARAFLDQLANGQIDFRAGADSKLLQQEQTLKNQIIALRQQLITLHNRPRNKWDADTIAQTETQIASLEKNYQDLLLQLKIQSPETADLITVDVASLSEIQDLLDADTTLIEYFVTEDRTLAFIITQNSFQTVTLNVTRKQLKDELTLFRDLGDIDEAHPQELQNLHDWLITPLQPHLNTAKIAIVPHGILHYLPFAALTDGNRYFSDNYALSTLPSASILRFLPEKRKSQTNSVLALGDADVPGLSPLNFARKEVQTIAQLFNSQPLLGKTATETSVWSKATQSGILHLAVHGEYNTNNALFSAIRLAGDTENDGRLEVHEVYGLDLTTTTNLVVLSACQTKIGELNKGDEVVGLNRAFLYAGTPTVIASLWNVDDAATGLLMERFYTHWQAGMSKAEALRQAQIEVRKDYPHPYFWAAFSLTGDGGR
ncbi:tetratricopeptide repeat protein [Coleofasciculus chthonoplastes]|uniref:tetratricopeptide repeat protein n=1 Tax=Coleofasciculus chthonoplastes TaxID=64178 RepID=UPI0032FD690F